jgi:tRNA-5-methyluridine54 2-sulfurtransferase
VKCRVCRGPAIIDVRRANANFCDEHFTRFCRDQVQRTIDEFEMIRPGERVLVAVSGGKDSLAVWDLLVGLGHSADGLYVGLGIGEYSDRSAEHARRFATERGLTLIEVDLPSEYGYDIPDGSRAARRAPCSACGTSKRHIFDSTAVQRGYDVLVTGHNLDDEAAVLFGNVLRWQTEYLARQLPVLPEGRGFPRKVKPLVRLSERETAAYCIVTGIDYQIDECPMSVGNKHLGYKDALNEIELQSPGTKADFYFSFLRRAQDLFRSVAEGEGDRGAAGDVLAPCTRCGSPTPGDVCAFCRLVERATAGSVTTDPTPEAEAQPAPASVAFRPRPAPTPSQATNEEDR